MSIGGLSLARVFFGRKNKSAILEIIDDLRDSERREDGPRMGRDLERGIPRLLLERKTTSANSTTYGTPNGVNLISDGIFD